MRRLLIFFVLIFATINLYAQDSLKNDREPWCVSEAKQAAPGFVGNYWANRVGIMRHDSQYYLVFFLYSPKGYFTKDVDNSLDVYLKDIEDKIVKLTREKSDYFTQKYEGYWSLNTWMPMRYATMFAYKIPNLKEFLSHTYVKYRIILGEEYIETDLKEKSFYKKFNKRLKEAANEADQKWLAKTSFINNPTQGF